MPDKTKKEFVVIDSHQHFWAPSEIGWPNSMPPEAAILVNSYKAEDLYRELYKVGVDYTVYVQCPPQNLDANQWMFKQANSAEFVAGVVAWVDLQNPDDTKRALDELEQEPKFVGIRHIVEDEPDVDWIVQPDVLESLCELARRKIPYDMLVKPRHLKNVLKVLDKVHNLKMVVDHIAKPEIAKGKTSPWQEDMVEIVQHPNVYCKLSGMITEADWKLWKTSDIAPYVYKVIEMFGYDRVMFGSDWPVCRLAGEYEDVWDTINEVLCDITKHQRENIFGANAMRFYNLRI